MTANLRLILDVEVQAGVYSRRLRLYPQGIKGSDAIMTEAERRGLPYLLKLRQSQPVKKLILEQHCRPGWERTVEGWEALATELTLSTWQQARRVILVRRKLSKNIVVAPDAQHALPIQLSLIEPAENMAA